MSSDESYVFETLAPVAEAARQFTKDYKWVATAVDTRHDLPAKNFYIKEDGTEFLEKAEACQKETEKLLQGDHQDNMTSLECLRDMKITSKDKSAAVRNIFRAAGAVVIGLSPFGPCSTGFGGRAVWKL